MNNPWYQDGIRFECVRCGVCCHDHGEYGFVFLTEGEPERIAAALGIEMKKLLDEYCVSVAGYLCIGNRGPACVFYDEAAGCTIHGVRPIQCKSWPFWPENLERKEWRRGVEKWCPGASGGELHSRQEIEAIAAEMRAAIPLHAPPGVRKV